MRNARVLPDPVRAAPRTSFPASSRGIDLAWTGVIVDSPISFSALFVCSDSSSVEKGCRPGTLSDGTAVGIDTFSAVVIFRLGRLE